MSSAPNQRTSAARFPTVSEFKEFYAYRARFFGQAFGSSLKALLEKNGVRFLVALIVGGAIAAGFIVVDWKAFAWPVLLILASFAISVLSLWFASACAVATNFRGECDILRGALARRHVDQAVATTLKTRFDAGLALLGDVAAPQFLASYEEWKAIVSGDLTAVSQEDEFVFGSSGFEHEIAMYQQDGPPELIRAESKLAMTAKLTTLREIVGKSFKVAEGGLVGLSSSP